jgi:hypothetical protein
LSSERYVLPTFRSDTPLGSARSAHTATLLTDATGKLIGVLIAGGQDSSGTSIKSAELYTVTP